MTGIAVVRVRAGVRMSANEEFALKVLHLDVPNSCAVVEDNAEKRGMIAKVAGMLTWGPVSDDTVALLRAAKKSPDASHFRLNPPRKGYSRKGAKLPFTKGGALGDRGVKINDLISRMVE